MKNKSVYLRAFEPNDYLLINKWRNDFNIQKLTCGVFRYVSTQMEKAWVEEKMMNNRNDIYLAICLNDGSNQMIGYTSFNKIDYINRSIEGGGIVIGEKSLSSGTILIDTFLLKFDYAFNHLNMNRYTAACLECHIDSRTMIEMMGLKIEGISRSAIYKNGKYNDMLNFSILKDEYDILFTNNGYSIENIAKRANQIRKQLKLK